MWNNQCTLKQFNYIYILHPAQVWDYVLCIRIMNDRPNFVKYIFKLNEKKFLFDFCIFYVLVVKTS